MGSPISCSDPTGTWLGADDAVGAGAGCLVNAGYTVLLGIMKGESSDILICKAGIDCMLGAIAGWIAANFPPASGCLFAAASSISRALARAVCTPCSEDPFCLVLGAGIGAIVGCFAGLALPGSSDKLTLKKWKDEVTQDITNKIIAAGVGKLWSHDVTSVCQDRLLEPT